MSARTILVLLILVAIALVACSAPAAPPTSAPLAATVAATAQSPAQPSAQAGPTTESSGETKINLNEYFPPGPGRDLTLESCMGCHSVAPIVIARKTKGEWDSNAVEHRGNVSRLSDAEYKQIYDYLTATFYPGKPVPKLPPELLRGFTNY